MNIYTTNIKLHSITPYFINELTKEYWFKDVQELRNNNEYNFSLTAKYIDIQYELAKLMLQFSRNFINFELDATRVTDAFAYVSTKNSNSPYIHNHKDFHSFTGVYYAYVPNATGGDLEFYDDDNKFIRSIKPKTNDFILFDGSLNHKPLPSNSDEYRISLNIGIQIHDRKR